MPRERPPQILQIYRDPLTAGREDAFDAVEKDAARVCARLGFPNPHLAIESLSGPKEVWWLNAFVSEADRDRVSSEYARNSALVAALDDIAKRKEGLTGIPVNILTAYLYSLYTMRGGRLSASDAMNHLLDVASGAQRAKTGFGQMWKLTAGWMTSPKSGEKEDRHV